MTTTTSARCNGQCPGGRRCSCSNTPHTLHLCSDKACTCHQERRYGLERAIVDGREVYRRAGAVEASVSVLEVRL